MALKFLSSLNFMIHDPDVSTSLTSPWMEGCSNYVLTVVVFWHAIRFSSRVFYMFEKTRRFSAVFFRSIGRVLGCHDRVHHYYDTSFMT